MKIAAPEKCDISKLHTYYTFTINELKAALMGFALAVDILAFVFAVDLLVGASL
ncbi:hypothetical protein [Methylobacter sp. S3L5C]|uniref:hypothetical protein n=1 Tax=Methylobacter sp. S3L5C TaxID=2839024 RepID=UPI001FAE0EAF|nr:hypothetical protein [Methylobacter sp. S3L5C]UOA06945.1 hypothetical protein KKZ03_11405 [Methylobacter sp. S3L5C]